MKREQKSRATAANIQAADESRELTLNDVRKLAKEARESLRIHPRSIDKDGAIAGDPCNCVFAKASARLFGGRAWFYDESAYIELPNSDGTWTWWHYIMPGQMRAQIAVFDATGIFDVGGYVLHAPSPTQTVSHTRKIRSERYESEKLVKARTKPTRKRMPSTRFRSLIRSYTGPSNLGAEGAGA